MTELDSNIAAELESLRWYEILHSNQVDDDLYQVFIQWLESEHNLNAYIATREIFEIMRMQQADVELNALSRKALDYVKSLQHKN